MATGGIQSICATMKRFIEAMKKEIKRKEDRIGTLETRLQKPNADRAAVQEMKDEIARLERELVDDRGQLNILEEEFSAECGVA